jgi:hypothetical protein
MNMPFFGEATGEPWRGDQEKGREREKERGGAKRKGIDHKRLGRHEQKQMLDFTVNRPTSSGACLVLIKLYTYCSKSV